MIGVVSWTDVTEAIAAVVGAVATPAAVLVSARSLRDQRGRAQAEARRLELRPVKAVIVNSARRTCRDPEDNRTRDRVVATVVNHGDDAVFDVTLQWRFGPDQEDVGSDYKGPLGPGERWECPAPSVIGDLPTHDQVGVFVTFFDGDSRGWAKTQRGDYARLRDALFEGW